MSETEKILSGRFSKWLSNIAAPLNSYIVLPTYFKKIEITGQENIPLTGPVIIAPTHRSRWDGLIVPHVVGLSTGRMTWFMVSSNEMKGLQGWLISRLGCFPVDHKHLSSDTITKSILLLLEDQILTIFPEGNIYRTEEVQTLKRGIARIALEVEEKRPGIGVKILPVSIKYSKAYPTYRSEVKIKIGTPLTASDYLDSSLKKSSEHLTQCLEKSLKSIHQEKNELPLSTF